MDYISSQIELYHNLYLFCLTGMIALLIVSVVLFLYLDVRTAIGFFTGTGKQQRITQKKSSFLIKREILLVHTDEII